MQNFKNYFMYADSIKNQQNIFVYVPDITVENIDEYTEGVFNILKDGIETDYVHNLKVTISWGDDIKCKLFIIDYWFNLFMWKMILVNGESIKPKHIFWQSELKRKNIKKFVDDYVLTRDNKIRLGNYFLNNNICDGLWSFSNIETFAYYLANTINNEDDINLMKACPEFDELYHMSLDGIPFEDVKEEGMKVTNRAIDIIKASKKYIGYDHGLAASFKAAEAINPRQFKEARFNIGTKPNGSGGIYPYAINKSFSNGGVNDKLSYFIESSSARTAQILSKNNVGDSGDFARILGLNNTDTILNKNPEYECLSKNFIKFNIKTPSHLSMIKNRYYRFNPNGMEYIIDPKDNSLVGKTIYLRSPITCSCMALGHGICRRCYGDLYYTNLDINVGKIAAEILSAQLTQILLSAKHLLETKIRAMKWNKEFYDWFDTNVNTIILADEVSDMDLKKYYILINPEDINLVSEEEDTVSYKDKEDDYADDLDNEIVLYNEYISNFTLRMPDGNEILFSTENNDPLYISKELNNTIRRKAAPDGGLVKIPLADLKDDAIFFIKIANNEISKTMEDIQNIINKGSVTELLDKDTAMQSIIDLVIDGHLSIDAVHLEVILANQILDINNNFKKPDWRIPNVPYKLVTLNTALKNNQSVIVSLLYQDLHKVLYNPLTFRKRAPSFFDLFFHEQPQNYVNPDLLDKNPAIEMPKSGLEMCKIIDNTKERK